MTNVRCHSVSSKTKEISVRGSVWGAGLEPPDRRVSETWTDEGIRGMSCSVIGKGIEAEIMEVMDAVGLMRNIWNIGVLFVVFMRFGPFCRAMRDEK